MINAINKSLAELETDFTNLVSSRNEEGSCLTKRELKKLSYLIYNSEFSSLLDKIKDNKISTLTATDMILIADNLNNLNKEIQLIKNEIELEYFFKDGKLISKQGLKKLYVKRDIHSKFPTFKLNELIDLIENPPLSIKNYGGKCIIYDSFFVKKMITAIVQMIFNEMDIKIINCGDEGSGKSCWASQQTMFFSTCFKKIGLNKDDFNVSKQVFSSVEAYLEDKDLQNNEDHFMIRDLDEAYDLNRQNFRELTNKIFKTEMRTGRKKLNLDILNLPQLGELEVAITLSRTNFIFICKMSNETKTMTLKKGSVEMYIIPRANKIYSPYYRKNITKSEIKKTLAKLLEKKENYYLEMPKELLIHKFEFPELWGFSWKQYKSHVMQQTKERRLLGDIMLSEYEQYIIFKKLPDTKHFGTFDLKNKTDKRMYDVYQKKMRIIKNKFLNNPSLLQKYELIYGKTE